MNRVMLGGLKRGPKVAVHLCGYFTLEEIKIL